MTGEWKGVSAGGCPNYPTTYPNNPKFKVEIDSASNNNQLLIELKGPKQYQMGLEVVIQQIQDETMTAPFKSKSSGPYRYVSGQSSQVLSLPFEGSPGLMRKMGQKTNRAFISLIIQLCVTNF